MKEKGGCWGQIREKSERDSDSLFGSSMTGPFTEMKNEGGTIGFGRKVMNSVLNFWALKCLCDS